MVLTDLHFADDIALLSDDIEKVQKVLSAVEGECMKVGLGLNTKKTKYLADNIDSPTPLHTSNTVLTLHGRRFQVPAAPG